MKDRRLLYRSTITVALHTVLACMALMVASGRPALAEQASDRALSERIDALEEQVERLGAEDEQMSSAVQAASALEERLLQLEARVGELTQQAGPAQERALEQEQRLDQVEAQTRSLAESREAQEATPWLDYTAGDGLIFRPPGRDFQLMLRGWVWALYDFSARSHEGQTSFTHNFSIPESRLRFTGVFFGGRVQVVLGPSIALGRPGLQDGYVELRLHQAAWIRIGQMLVPYDWESNTSPPCLPLVGLGSIPRFFGHGRDLGVMLMGTLPGDKVHYRVAVFNGAGRGSTNDNHFPMAAAFVRIQALGSQAPGWGWSDLERSTTPNLSFGVGFTYDYEATTADDYADIAPGQDPAVVAYNRSVYQVNADAFLRWYGVSFALVGHYRGTSGEDLELTNVDGETAVLPFVNGYGLMLHLGYMAWVRRLELLVRFSQIDPDVEVDTPTGREVIGGLTLFLLGHQIKLTALYGYQWRMPFAAPANVDGHVIQVQAQGWF